MYEYTPYRGDGELDIQGERSILKDGENMKKEKIMCNKCGKELMIKNGILHEDGIFVTKEWGYFSGKDLQIHQFCLCESCYDEFTESFFIPVENQEKRVAMD